jgi:hypothetical protein
MMVAGAVMTIIVWTTGTFGSLTPSQPATAYYASKDTCETAKQEILDRSGHPANVEIICADR